MSSRLIDSLATTDALAEVFADRSILQAMLDFETALARAEVTAGVIPPGRRRRLPPRPEPSSSMRRPSPERRATPDTVSIPLVKALTARVQAADAASARFVHFGATSQDVADSAMVLTLAARTHHPRRRSRASRRARSGNSPIVMRRTVMLGRTLLQPAPPITFGLKVAGWAGALGRAWRRVQAAMDDAAVLQFGGASGTLAALGDRGQACPSALAGDLGLGAPDAPWHTHRDRLAALVDRRGDLHRHARQGRA